MLLLLKWIGILLAVLLGLLLVLLAAALLIPVRYRIKADTTEGTRVWARAGWLFRLVCLKGSYLDGEFSCRLTVLGIPVKTRGGEEKPRKEKKKRKKKKSAHRKKPKAPPEKKPVEPETEERRQIPGTPQEPAIPAAREPVRGQEEGKPDETESKPGPLKKLAEWISGLWNKILRQIRRFKNKITGLRLNMKNLFHKGRKLLSFFRDEGNKPGFLLVFSSLRRSLKHLHPTKVRGSILFGTGDPCSTGQLLGLAGLLYGWYGKDVTVTPDFEEKVFKARLMAKGRIRAGTLLIIIGKLFFNGDFQNVLKQWRQVKEDF